MCSHGIDLCFSEQRVETPVVQWKRLHPRFRSVGAFMELIDSALRRSSRCAAAHVPGAAAPPILPPACGEGREGNAATRDRSRCTETETHGDALTRSSGSLRQRADLKPPAPEDGERMREMVRGCAARKQRLKTINARVLTSSRRMIANAQTDRAMIRTDEAGRILWIDAKRVAMSR